MMYDHLGVGIVLDLIPTDIPLKVLDIGSGYGYWGYILKAYLEYEPTIWGIEVNPKCIRRLKRLGIYDFIIEGNANSHDLWAINNYNLAILSHFVEHIKKKEALDLISILKTKCDQIIIVCPEGDAICENDEIGFSHLSKWTKKDFEKIGMQSLQLALSHRAGRVVSQFERLYFKLKGLTRWGILIAWWNQSSEAKAKWEKIE